MDNETQEIERGSWAAFAEEFTKQHVGATASLESLSADSGDQFAAENLPFVGLSLETKGSAAGSLVVMLGTEGSDHLERIISSLQGLRLRLNTQTGETVLEIESADDPTLLLHLHPLTALPAPE